MWKLEYLCLKEDVQAAISLVKKEQPHMPSEKCKLEPHSHQKGYNLKWLIIGTIARSTNGYNCIGKKTSEVTFEDKDPGGPNCTPCYRPCKHMYIYGPKKHIQENS